MPKLTQSVYFLKGTSVAKGKVLGQVLLGMRPEAVSEGLIILCLQEP